MLVLSYFALSFALTLWFSRFLLRYMDPTFFMDHPNERKIHDCEGCFEHVSLKENLESKIQKIEQVIEDALKKIQELQKEKTPNKAQIEIYEKLVTRSLFGNINASRNSA